MTEQTEALPKACCLTCVFLRDAKGPEKGHPVLSLSQEDRDKLAAGNPISAAELQCYRSMWGPLPTDKAVPLLKEDRNKRCLFYPHKPNMFPCAGVEMWRLKQLKIDRQVIRDEAKKDREHAAKEGREDREHAASVAAEDRKWIRRGVWVAVAGLFLNLAWEIVKYFCLRAP